MHFGLDPGWLDPLEHIYALTMQKYDYLVHDALIKPMPQGESTYSLAEHAEMTADFRQGGLPPAPGPQVPRRPSAHHRRREVDLRELQGRAREDVPRAELEHIEVVDDRTIVFHFKEPFLEFMELYNGGVSGIGWIVPKHYYEKVGQRRVQGPPDRRRALQVRQPGSRRADDLRGLSRTTGGARRRRRPSSSRASGSSAARVAGLQTGELDLAYGMTGKLLPRVMADKNLRWDPQLHRPLVLMFPGYNEPDSPFHDKRVRQAVSLAINRQFLVAAGDAGHRQRLGQLDQPGESATPCKGDGKELPVPEYNPEKAKQLLAQTRFPQRLRLRVVRALCPLPRHGRAHPHRPARRRHSRASSRRWKVPSSAPRSARAARAIPGNQTIVQNIDPRPGGAKASISRLRRVRRARRPSSASRRSRSCGRSIRRASNPDERDRLIKAIQKILVEDVLHGADLLESLRARRGAPKCYRKARASSTTGTPCTRPTRGPGRSGK